MFAKSSGLRRLGRFALISAGLKALIFGALYFFATDAQAVAAALI